VKSLVIACLVVSAALAAPRRPAAAPTQDPGVSATSPPDSTMTPTEAPAPATAPTTTTPPAAAPATAPPATAPPPTTPPPPQQTAPAKSTSASKGAFSKGTNRASFTVGWGRSFGDDYLLLGLGIGRFLRNGLEISLDYQAWVGSDPGVQKLSPSVLYVMTKAPRITPYAGAFYTRTFIQDYDDLSSIGGRAGVFKGAGRTAVGAGIVYEDYLSCDDSIYGGCSDVYPEVFVSTSF
jgi:hypothetical protein